MRVRARRQQGQQRDGDEVAERRRGPMNLSSTVEPAGIDEEDDGRYHDLAEPADDEEQRREHDPPEAELGQSDGVREVEHVPRNPEDEGTEQERCGECEERNDEPAGNERAEPEDSQQETEDGTHTTSTMRKRALLPIMRS